MVRTYIQGKPDQETLPFTPIYVEALSRLTLGEDMASWGLCLD